MLAETVHTKCIQQNNNKLVKILKADKDKRLITYTEEGSNVSLTGDQKNGIILTILYFL